MIPGIELRWDLRPISHMKKQIGICHIGFYWPDGGVAVLQYRTKADDGTWWGWQDVPVNVDAVNA